MTTRIAVNASGVTAYYLGREPLWAREKFAAGEFDYALSNDRVNAYVVGLVAVIRRPDGFTLAYFCDDTLDAVKICSSFAGLPQVVTA